MTAGCFTDPPSAAGDDDDGSGGASTGDTPTSGSTATPTSGGATDGTADGSATSSGTTGTADGGTETTSSESGIKPEACGMGEVCLDPLRGWVGPYLVLAGPDAPPGCPPGQSLAWSAQTDLEIPDCQCSCGDITPDAPCSAFISIGSDATCSGAGEFSIEDGECVPFMGLSDGTLGVLAEAMTSEGVCASPPPPVPMLTSEGIACELPPAGDCGKGSCFPTGPAMQGDICLEWTDASDAPPCPPLFPEARTFATGVDGSALDCSTCECEAIAAECVGTVSAFVELDCGDGFAGLANVTATCEAIEDPLVDAAQALRYDAAVAGACGSSSGKEQAVPRGEATLEGVHQLCCL